MAVDVSLLRSLESREPAAPADASRRRRRVGVRALAVTTRQLAVMVGAGLPIVHGLHLLAEQAESSALRWTLHDLAQRLAAGSTLAQAVEIHPDVFPPLYASLVEAGEVAGVLDAVLHRLAAYLEQSARLRRTVIGALAYPACVVGAAFAVSGILLLWVVPVFAGVFASFGAELPAPTRIVVGLSGSLRAHAWMLATVVLGGTTALALAGATPTGRQLRDRWVLRVPILGDLLAKAAVARAIRTLGTLVASGVAILDALDVAARTAGNGVIAEAFSGARTSLARGRSLAEPLGESHAIPPMVRQMVAAGEATGTLDVMLARVADLYDDEVHTAASNLLALLEPVLMLFLGIVVGGLVMSMYPVFGPRERGLGQHRERAFDAQTIGLDYDTIYEPLQQRLAAGRIETVEPARHELAVANRRLVSLGLGHAGSHERLDPRHLPAQPHLLGRERLLAPVELGAFKAPVEVQVEQPLARLRHAGRRSAQLAAFRLCLDVLGIHCKPAALDRRREPVGIADHLHDGLPDGAVE